MSEEFYYKLKYVKKVYVKDSINGGSLIILSNFSRSALYSEYTKTRLFKIYTRAK